MLTALICLLAVSTPPQTPKPVKTYSVCLDPGHPSEVGAGATGKKISEVQAVWEIAKALAKELERSGVKVVLTKSKANEKVTNKRRAEIANKAKVDLFVRLHMDASSERGLATYYPKSAGTIDKTTGPPADVRKASGIAAGAFHTAVIKSLDGTLRDRRLRTDTATAVGAKYGALVGSIYSKVPVILVEVLVITNPQDEAVFLDPKGKKRIIASLHVATLAALMALNTEKTPPSLDP